MYVMLALLIVLPVNNNTIWTAL